MLVDIAFYILVAYSVIWHLPRFIYWLFKVKYRDDSFYETQSKGVNKLTDYF